MLRMQHLWSNGLWHIISKIKVLLKALSSVAYRKKQVSYFSLTTLLLIACTDSDQLVADEPVHNNTELNTNPTGFCNDVCGAITAVLQHPKTVQVVNFRGKKIDTLFVYYPDTLPCSQISTLVMDSTDVIFRQKSYTFREVERYSGFEPSTLNAFYLIKQELTAEDSWMLELYFRRSGLGILARVDSSGGISEDDLHFGAF